jgi:glutamate-1-semialdehyde 2,1-aminomutase
MASGVAGLRHLYPPEVAARHTARGEAFRARLNGIVAQLGLPAQVTGVGTLMCVHFHDRPVKRPADTEATRPEARALFHLEMLARGFYFARRGYMSLSLALEEVDYDGYARAFEEVLGEHGKVLCGK